MRVLPRVVVQSSVYDVAAETRAIVDGRTDIGALVHFSGLCRDEGGTLSALELEHYPGMAEAELTRIATLAIDRFDLKAMTVIHRYGKIRPGDDIVLVIAASSHRQAAFDGANFVMDFLKTAAPFWKKEHGSNGQSGEWVAARDADDAARDRWGKA
ncbi:MAG: molybdopterin converting factor large subunit [Pseudomonadota bacterium]